MTVQERERPDLNLSNSFEELSLNGEVVLSTKLTLDDLLGLKENIDENLERRQVGLDNVPFIFEVRDLGDSLLNIASFSEEYPLDSKKLLSLLSGAKSGGIFRKGQFESDIIGDWDIILPEVREKRGIKKAFYDHHKQYVPGFSEFEENHFQKFWDAINSTPEEVIKKEEHSFFHRQFSRFVTEEDSLARYGVEFFTANYPRGLLRMHRFWEYRDLTIEFLKGKNHDLSDLKDKPVDFSQRLESLFNCQLNRAEWKKFQEEWYNFIISRVGEKKLALDAASIQFFYSGNEIIFVDKNGSPCDFHMALDPLSEHKLDSWMLRGASAIKKVDDGEIKVSKGEAHMIVSFVADERGIRKRIIKEIQHSPNPPAYPSPAIIWKRDKKTKKASYFCGKIPQELIQSFPHLFSKRHDTLCGQLVVGVYSPEARDQMPTEITMEGRNGRIVTQQMLEAQTVLLVPQYAQLFLEQSPVILSLEELK